MTIALAVFLFDLSITLTNGIGIFLTLVGGVSGWIPVLSSHLLCPSLYSVPRREAGRDNSASADSP
jgi:hypothetical protein